MHIWLGRFDLTPAVDPLIRDDAHHWTIGDDRTFDIRDFQSVLSPGLTTEMRNVVEAYPVDGAGVRLVSKSDVRGLTGGLLLLPSGAECQRSIVPSRVGGHLALLEGDHIPRGAPSRKPGRQRDQQDHSTNQ